MAINETIERFREDYIGVIRSAKNAIPPDKIYGNGLFKKYSTQLEFLEGMVGEVEQSLQDAENAARLNASFMALAEQIKGKMVKFRIGDNDFLLPAQREQLDWIKKMLDILLEEQNG